MIQTIIKLLQALSVKLSKVDKNDQKSLEEIQVALNLIKDTVSKEHKTNAEKLATLAKENLGRDITPNDRVPDEVACAEVVSTLLKKVDPSIPIVSGTWTLSQYLKNSGKFKPTLNLDAGCIVISPTGEGNGIMRGHVAIALERAKLASNDSYTGKWIQNYTLETWVNRYKKRGQFPVYIYKML